MRLITVQLCVGDTFTALHQLLDHAVETRAIKAWDIVEGDNGNAATPSTPITPIADGTATALPTVKPKRKWTRRTPKTTPQDHAAVQKCGTVTVHETKDGKVEVRK